MSVWSNTGADREVGYGVSVLGYIQMVTGQDLEQPAPAHYVCARVWTKWSPEVPSYPSILVMCELRTSLLLQEWPADLCHYYVCSYLTAMRYRVVLCSFSRRRETEAPCCSSSPTGSVAELPLANHPWSSSSANAPGLGIKMRNSWVELDTWAWKMAFLLLRSSCAVNGLGTDSANSEILGISAGGEG